MAVAQGAMLLFKELVVAQGAMLYLAALGGMRRRPATIRLSPPEDRITTVQKP
jgi:hypothetical protein